MWSFLAPEFYGNIKRERGHSVPISFTGSPAPPPVRAPKAVLIRRRAPRFYQSASAKWIYATARRGARVCTPSTLARWRGSPRYRDAEVEAGLPNQADDTGCSSGFTGMGQTWSAPQVLKTNAIRTSRASSRCWSWAPATTPARTATRTPARVVQGSRGYVLDANDGTLLEDFTTDRPVAADVFVVPDTTTGLAKFVYVADTAATCTGSRARPRTRRSTRRYRRAGR
jgi:type IV pilus assembly protein PilY1